MKANQKHCKIKHVIAIPNNQEVTVYKAPRISSIPNKMIRFANNVSNTAVYQ